MEKGVCFPDKDQTTVDEIMSDESCGDLKPGMDVDVEGSSLETAEGVGTEEFQDEANLEVVEVKFGDLRNGAKLMEEDLSCQEERQSARNDHVQAAEGVVGAIGGDIGDGTGGDCKSEMDVKEVGSMAESAEAAVAVSLERFEVGSLDCVLDLGGGQVESVVLRKETGTREGGVLCEEENQNTNSEMDGDLVDGHFQAPEGILEPRDRDLGDGSCGDQKSETDLVEEGSTEPPVGVVAAGGGLETEDLEIVPNMERVQVKIMKIDDGTGVTENGVSCPRKSESMVNDATGLDSVGGHLQAAEGTMGCRCNGQSQAEVVEEFTAGKEDMGEGLFSVINQGTVPQVFSGETDVVYRSMMDGDHCRKQEVSALQASLVNANQDIQVEGNTLLDSVPADDTLSHQAYHAMKDLNPADPVVVHPQVLGRETEAGDGSMEDADQDRDNESTASQMPLVDANQDIQEEGNAGLDSVPADDTISDQAYHVAEDSNTADLVVEVQSQVMTRDAEVGDGSMMDGNQDRDQEATASQIPITDTNQNIQEEGNDVLDSIPVDDTVRPQADQFTKDPNPANPVLKVQVMGRETEVGGGSRMDDNQDIDQEITALQTPLLATSQNIREEGKAALDSIPVDDTVSPQADQFTEDPIPANLVVEAQPQVMDRETEVGDGSMMDYQEATASQTPLEDTNQYIQEEDQFRKDPNPAYPVVEVQPQVMDGETEIGDESMMDGGHDRDLDASVSHMSLVDTDRNIQEEDQFTEDPNPADPVVEVQPQVMDGETELGDGSGMDDNKDRDPENTALQTPLLTTSQNLREESKAALVSIPVDGTVSPQADQFTEDPILANLVVEAQPHVMGRETEVGDGSMMDYQEATASQTPLEDTNQNIQEEDQFRKDPNLAYPVVDVQPQVMDGKTEIGDESMVDGDHDRDQEASVSHTSLVYTDRNIQEEDQFTEDPNPANPVVEVQPQVMDGETQLGDGSGMDDNQDRDQENTALQSPLFATSQNIREEGKAALDSIPVDDTVSPQAYQFIEDPIPANLVVEAQPHVMDRETEVGDGSTMDYQEATASQMPLVDTNQNNQEEDPNPAYPVVEVQPQEMDGETEIGDESMVDGDHDRDQEASVSHTSLVDTDRNIQEEDQFREDPNPADPLVEVQPQVMDGETEVGDGSRMDDNQDGDQENTALQTPLFATSQKFREEGKGALDSIPVDDTTSQQADQFTVDPIPANLVVEAQPHVMGRETEVGDGSMMDYQEATASQTPLADTNQNNQEEDQFTKDPNPAYPVVEVQPQIMDGETEIGDESVVDDDHDRDQEASVSHTSLVDTDRNMQEEDQFTEDPKSADQVVEVQSQVMDGETEVGDESTVDGDHDRDQEASVLHTDLVDTNRNIQEEGDTVFGSVPVDDTIIHQEDHATKDPSPTDLVVEVRALVMGGECEVGYGSMMDSCHERDHKVSVLETSLAGVDQNIQEEGNTVLDSVPVYDTISDPADHVKEDLNSADLLVEVRNPDSHPVYHLLNTDISIIAEPKTVSTVPVAEAENADANLVSDDLMGSGGFVTTDTHRVDENVMDKEDIVVRDENSVLGIAVVESQSGGTQLVDENPNNIEDNIMVVSCLVVETQTADTCSLDENLMDKAYNVMETSNSIVEINVSETLEHSVVSQGIESFDFLPGENQEIEAESVGSLVDGSLANAHLVEYSPGGSQKMVMESKVMKKDMSPSDACCKEIELVQKLEFEQEIPALENSLGTVLMDEGTDGEQNLHDVEQVLLKRTENEAVECVTTSTGTSLEKNDHASYYLPPQDRANFSISDLVWGKVKSHPWWPGQIVDPSDASEMALKHQKKDNFLVAYFGDKTFAWRKESKLKHFHANFPLMEKQSSLDAFEDAVNDILVEVSRRIELGMTCFCLPEEADADIKYQKVENAGIREGIITRVIDRSQILNYFEPGRLLEYIEALAQLPTGGANRMELVIAQAQLNAFYRSKGCPELPVFTLGGGLMEEDAAETSPPSSKKSRKHIVDHFTPTPSDLHSGRSGERAFKKQKHILHDGRKKKSLSELMEEENDPHLANGGKVGSGVKATENSISSSGKKQKLADSDSADSGNNKKSRLDFLGDFETKSPSPTLNSSFKIGECIRRAASQLTGAPPILKCHGETLQKSVPKADHVKGDVFGIDVLPCTPVETPRTKIDISVNYSSLSEMLSQLCLAARDPIKGYSFVSMIVSFFTGFRNSCIYTSSDKKRVEKTKGKRGRKKKVNSQSASSQDKKHVEKTKGKRGRKKKINSQSASSQDKKHVEKTKGKRGRKKKVNSESASSVVSTRDHMDDAYWSDTILHNNPENNLSNGLKRKDESRMPGQKKRRKSAEEPSLSLPSGPMLDTARKLQVGVMSSNMKHAFATERSIITVEEKIVDECNPTALILCFNHSNSIPSETDLIRIFSRYGPLKEAETDVLRKTNRAKVVFKRRADAEIAFSSAGKFSIFGPGLLSYRLRYLPSTPKSSPDTTPQGKHDETPIEGGNLIVSSLDTTQGKHGDGNLEVSSLYTTPQGVHGAAPIEDGNLDVSAPDITPQGKQDAASTEGGNLEVSSPDTIPQGNHDAAPIKGGNLEVSSPDTTPQDKHDAAPIEGGNIEVSSPDTTPQGKHDAEPTEGGNIEVSSPDTTPQGDAEPTDGGNIEVSSPDATPQGKHDAEHTEGGNIEVSSTDTTLQSRHDAELTEGGNLEVSSLDITPQGKHDTAPIEGDNLDVCSSQTTAQGKHVVSPIEDGNLEVSSPDTTPRGKHDASPIECGDLEVPAPIKGGNLDVSSPDITPQGKNDAASIEGVNLEVSSPDTTPQGKHDAEPIEGGNLEVSSLDIVPQGKHDTAPIEGDNLDVSSSETTEQGKHDASPIEDGNLEVSSQTPHLKANMTHDPLNVVT